MPSCIFWKRDWKMIERRDEHGNHNENWLDIEGSEIWRLWLARVQPLVFCNNAWLLVFPPVLPVCTDSIHTALHALQLAVPFADPSPLVSVISDVDSGLDSLSPIIKSELHVGYVFPPTALSVLQLFPPPWARAPILPESREDTFCFISKEALKFWDLLASLFRTVGVCGGSSVPID